MSEKKQIWNKLGLLFCPDGNIPWMVSHASVPFVERLHGDVFKLYFSCRNLSQESMIAYAIFELQGGRARVEKVSSTPILEKGELGAFDDSGCMGSCLVNVSGKKYLYYIGWNLGETVPFRNSIGLAISDDGESFQKAYKGPIVDRSMTEPHFCASSCVLKEGNIFRMWYLSCTGWTIRNGNITHNYHIKYADSDDGILWRRNGAIAIDYANEYEYAISVPRVIKDGNIYKMWFSSRARINAETYRIGYAESDDGIKWQRLDHLVGLDVSTVGWDSEMIEYPFVFDHNGDRYMLYNGNGYGKTGIGLAILERE